MTRNRTDIHRPSADEFDPETYDCYGVFDNCTDPMKGGGPQRERIEAVNALVARGFRFGAGSSHQCGHCGAHIRYCALMVREDVKQFIFVGETCLDGRFEMTKSEFDALRRSAQLDREQFALRTAFEALCEQNPALTYATYANNIDLGTVAGWELSTLADIARKARQYGSVSERQIAFLDKLWGKVEEKVAAAAVRAAQDAAAGPVPSGRVVLTGEVLSVKSEVGYIGYHETMTLKVLVKLDNGAKVYGTLPAAIDTAERGDIVTFTATVTPKEESFGYYSRPAKASFVSTTVAA